MSYIAKWRWKGKPYQYVFSDEDTLNLARATQFEGAPRDAVAWTLLRRFSMLNSMGIYRDFSTFVHAYAQPINPKWFADGAAHREYVRTLLGAGKRQEAANEEKLALRRPVQAATSWASLSPEVRALVQAIMTGTSSERAYPAVHYTASHGATKAANQAARPDLRLVDVGAEFGPGNNVFYTAPNALSLTDLKLDSYVDKKPLLAVTVAGAIAYALYRYWS